MTVSSLGVVYLLGVVVVSAYWGLRLGVVMSLLSAATFNFFHLSPVLRFTISDSHNWASLIAFLVVAVATSSVSELARSRAIDAERRRVEADLASEFAQILLARGAVEEALASMGRRLAVVLALGWASITLMSQPSDDRHEAISKYPAAMSMLLASSDHSRR